MSRTRVTVVLSGLAIIVIAAIVGYGLGTLVEQRGIRNASPTPEATATPSPVSPTPTASSTAAPRQVPAAAPTGPDTPQQQSEMRVVLEPLPEVVRAGAALLVRWRIHGPVGLSNIATRLSVVPEHGSPVVGASASAVSLPARFEATVTVPNRGNVTFVAEVFVNGQTVRAEQRVTAQ
ncbi:MAG: hypothetical protein Q8R32_00975 [bacterium]|nr:hypothetical protein [bacterium]